MLRLFQGRSVLKSVLANTSLLVSDRVLRYGVGFFIGAGIARYLGPEQYGLLSYVLALVAILMPIMGVGLDNLIVRELVKQPHNTYEVLGSAFVLRVLGGLSMVLTACGLTLYLRPGDTSSLVLVLIMETATMMLCFDVLEVWFQSQLQSKYAVYGKGAAFLAVSAIKIVLIVQKAPVSSIIVAGLVEAFLGAVGLVYFFRKAGYQLGLFATNKTMFKLFLRDGWALVLSGFAAVVCLRVDQLIVSKLLGDSAAGVYSAAFRFSEFAYALPALISVSVLPILVESRQTGQKMYQDRLRAFLNLMSFAGLLVSCSIAALSGFIIPFLFGSAYAEASQVLSVQIWASVFVFLGVASNQYLIIEKRTDIILVRTLIGMTANIALNSIAIPKYGLMGAALVSVVSNAIAVFSVAFYGSQKAHTVELLTSFNYFRTVTSLRRTISENLQSNTLS